MNQLIKYIFLGNIDKKVIIGTYPLKNDKYIQSYYNKAKGIFDSIILTNEINGSIQQKKVIEKEIFYYTIKKSNIFYLIITPKSTDENTAFSFIDEIENCNIYLLVNDKTNTLNDYGKNELKKVYIEFNKNPTLLSSARSNNSKVDIIENELKETKKMVSNGIKDMIVNIDNLNDMEIKSSEIKNSSIIVMNKSKKLKLNDIWENTKFKIFFVCLIILIVIVLIIYVGSKK